MQEVSIKEFYKDICTNGSCQLGLLTDINGNTELGHFNVFEIENFYYSGCKKTQMSYNRRLYYKISLIKGSNLVEYADKSQFIEKQAILFATPKIPYRFTPQDEKQSGFFCVFTKDFVSKSKIGLVIDDLPIFLPSSDFFFFN